MLLPFLLVLDQLNLATVRGFLSLLRINLASEEGQHCGAHSEIPDFHRATAGGNHSSSYLDLIFLKEVSRSSLGL